MSSHLHRIETTAHALVASGKGILAADESEGTIAKWLFPEAIARRGMIPGINVAQTGRQHARPQTIPA